MIKAGERAPEIAPGTQRESRYGGDDESKPWAAAER